MNKDFARSKRGSNIRKIPHGPACVWHKNGTKSQSLLKAFTPKAKVTLR